MYDIAGLRMMCQFVDDIDVVVNMLDNVKILKLSKKEIILTIQNKVVIVHIM